jgi:hypothetical protein
VKAVLREITKLSAICDRSVVRSSVTPSAKYCCSRSSLRLAKGRTTIDKRGTADGTIGAVVFSSGGAVTVADGALGDGHRHHNPPAMISKPASARAATCLRA